MQVWTPGEITMAEAVLTILHTAVLVLHAYAQERRYPYLSFSCLGSPMVHPIISPSGAHDASRSTNPKTWGDPGMEPKGSRLSLLENAAPLGTPEGAGTRMHQEVPAFRPGGLLTAQSYGGEGFDTRETGVGALSEGPGLLGSMPTSSAAKRPSEDSLRTPLSSICLVQPGSVSAPPPIGVEGYRERSGLHQHQFEMRTSPATVPAGAMGSSSGVPKSPLREIPACQSVNQRSQSFNRKGTNDHFVSVDGMRRRSLGKAEGEVFPIHPPPHARDFEAAIERSPLSAVFRTSSGSLSPSLREEVAQLRAQFPVGPFPRTASGATTSFLPHPHGQTVQATPAVHLVQSVNPGLSSVEVEMARRASGPDATVDPGAGATMRCEQAVPSLMDLWKQQIANSFVVW